MHVPNYRSEVNFKQQNRTKLKVLALKCLSNYV